MRRRASVRLVALALAAFALGACRNGEGPIAGYLDDLRRHLDELERTVAVHGDDACAAGGEEALARIETEHGAAVQKHIDALLADVTNIQQCAEEGRARHNAWLSYLLGRAHAEVERHRAAQSGAPGSDALVEEETRHERAMRDLIAELGERRDRARREEPQGGSALPAHRCPARPTR